MNLYEIEYSAGSGTDKKAVRITALSELQARSDFRKNQFCSDSIITNVVLIRTNAAATKQQERDALTNIQKIIDELGSDSYLKAAFDGCFEIAENNIENDEYCSMAARVRCTEEAYDELRKALDKQHEAVNAAKSEIVILKSKLYDFMTGEYKGEQNDKI